MDLSLGFVLALIPFLHAKGGEGTHDSEASSSKKQVVKDMAYSPDRVRKDVAAAAAAGAMVGDEEMGLQPSNQHVENEGDTTPGEKSLVAKLKQDLKLALALITIAAVALIDLFFLRGDIKVLSKSLTLAVSAFFAFTSFISGISFMFHTMKLMTLKPHLIPKSHLVASKVLFSVSAASLVLITLAILLSMMPRAYYFLPLLLLPSLLVAGFHFYLRPETVLEINPEATNISHKADLKRGFQLTLSLISSAFLGFLAVLLGLFHSSSSLAAHSYVKVSINLMLSAALAGILSILLCRVIPKDRRSESRQWMMLATANILMLGLIVPAVLIIATTFLEGLLVATFFPVVVAAVIRSFLEFCITATTDDVHRDGATSHKMEHNNMYAVSTMVTSVSFGAIMSIFAGFLGGSADNDHLKVCMFFLVSGFIAAVSLGVVTFRTPKKASLAVAAMALACCALGLLVLAALALFYRVG